MLPGLRIEVGGLGRALALAGDVGEMQVDLRQPAGAGIEEAQGVLDRLVRPGRLAHLGGEVGGVVHAVAVSRHGLVVEVAENGHEHVALADGRPVGPGVMPRRLGGQVQPRHVEELQLGVDAFAGLEQIEQPLQPLVGNLDHGEVLGVGAVEVDV